MNKHHHNYVNTVLYVDISYPSSSYLLQNNSNIYITMHIIVYMFYIYIYIIIYMTDDYYI